MMKRSKRTSTVEADNIHPAAENSISTAAPLKSATMTKMTMKAAAVAVVAAAALVAARRRRRGGRG
jgi:hypothetical protein